MRTPFSRGGVTVNDTTQYSKLSVLDNTYLNGGNQIRNRFGAAAGSVLDADYGSLTITFDTPVNSFGIDLATIARGISGASSGTFVLTAAGGSTTYLYSGSYGFGFLGLTSDTAFSSITLTAPTANDDVFDNITLGVAPAAAAVPEPASWAMMLAGFGLVGAGMAPPFGADDPGDLIVRSSGYETAVGSDAGGVFVSTVGRAAAAS